MDTALRIIVLVFWMVCLALFFYFSKHKKIREAFTCWQNNKNSIGLVTIMIAAAASIFGVMFMLPIDYDIQLGKRAFLTAIVTAGVLIAIFIAAKVTEKEPFGLAKKNRENRRQRKENNDGKPPDIPPDVLTKEEAEELEFIRKSTGEEF